MKKVLALFLILTLTVSLTGPSVFADGGSGQFTPSQTEGSATPALVAGSLLTPVSQIPPDMNVGDTVTFAMPATCFQGFANFDVAKLSVAMTEADAACFLRTFTKDENAVYLNLKAVAECTRRDIAFYVTDGTILSAPYTFKTAVSNPPPATPASSSSSQPESSSSSQPESSSSSQPESSSSSQPESSSSSQPESSSSSQPESSSSSQPESSSSSQPESSSSSQPAAPLSAPPPTTITNGINGVDATGSRWEPVSGISGSNPLTITINDKIVFWIPDNNFATNGSAATPGDNLATLNTVATFKNSVQIMRPSGTPLDVSGNFSKNFVYPVGGVNAYGIELTPDLAIPDEGLSLPKGTTFGFGTVTAKYSLPMDVLVVKAGSSSTRAVGISPNSYLGYNNTWVTKNGKAFSGDLDNLDVRQGDEFLIHFMPSFFEWSGVTPQKVTLSNIRNKISLRQSYTSGSKVFEAVDLTTVKGEAVVRIKFKQPLATVKPIDFRTAIYLYVGGKRDEDSRLDIEGVVDDIDPMEFFSEEKDIDISGGEVGVAEETLLRVKVYIGDGVTINVPVIRKNAKFYGMATNSEISKKDEEILDQYPDIVEVYTLATVGLNGAGVTVDIDEYNGYYVYDEDLNYLGRSTKKLEYSNKYYLSSKMLDIEEDEEEEYEDEPYDDYPGKVSLENENYNPSTGR